MGRASVNRAPVGRPACFATTTILIESGQTSVTVLAHHCDLAEGSSALAPANPRRSWSWPPAGDRAHRERAIVIGVRRPTSHRSVPARDYNGTPFRIWQEVTASSTDRRHGSAGGLLERRITRTRPPTAGRRNRGPTLMAAAPRGCEIRACTGAVAVRPGIFQLARSRCSRTRPVRTVTNPTAATGGRPAETLDEALIRGPQELHGSSAPSSRGLRAIALGRAAPARAWVRKGQCGSTRIQGRSSCCRAVRRRKAERKHLTRRSRTRTRPRRRAQIQQAIDGRRPLGTTCQSAGRATRT